MSTSFQLLALTELDRARSSCYGGALFKSFGTIEERLVELQAVPRLKARGFDDARLVAIIRDGGRFSTVLEALGNDILRYHDENIPSEYMVRTDV